MVVAVPVGDHGPVVVVPELVQGGPRREERHGVVGVQSNVRRLLFEMGNCAEQCHQRCNTERCQQDPLSNEGHQGTKRPDHGNCEKNVLRISLGPRHIRRCRASDQRSKHPRHGRGPEAHFRCHCQCDRRAQFGTCDLTSPLALKSGNSTKSSVNAARQGVHLAFTGSAEPSSVRLCERSRHPAVHALVRLRSELTGVEACFAPESGHCRNL